MPAPEATPSAASPLVAYVKHTKPPVLFDTSAASPVFGVGGGIASYSMGKDIVHDNDVQDPSGDIALAIATAFAASKGGRMADQPLPDDHPWTGVKTDDLMKQAGGARYVIDIDPVSMNVIYFQFDWTHYDLLFGTRVRIIDTMDGKVLAKGKCSFKMDKAAAKTHAELIDNGAAGLKKRIAERSQACVALMKVDLRL